MPIGMDTRNPLGTVIDIKGYSTINDEVAKRGQYVYDSDELVGVRGDELIISGNNLSIINGDGYILCTPSKFVGKNQFNCVLDLKGKIMIGKITLPLGKVEIKTENSDIWIKVKPNWPVFEGDIIRTTSKSRAEITLQSGRKVRIGPESELELIEEDLKSKAKDFSSNLKRGGGIVVAAKAAFGAREWSPYSDVGSVAGIRG